MQVKHPVVGLEVEIDSPKLSIRKTDEITSTDFFLPVFARGRHVYRDYWVVAAFRSLESEFLRGFDKATHLAKSGDIPSRNWNEGALYPLYFEIPA